MNTLRLTHQLLADHIILAAFLPLISSPFLKTCIFRKIRGIYWELWWRAEAVFSCSSLHGKRGLVD